MSKRAEETAYNYTKAVGTLGYDYNQIYDAVKNGYEQAEKDLALTWQDVAILIALYEQEIDAGNISRYEDEGAPSLQEASEIILKRFKEIRKK